MGRYIYLLRHGETVQEGNEKRCIGQTDLPLSEPGRQQAGKIGRWLQGEIIERIYSSPLSRCIETANIVRQMCMEENGVSGDCALRGERNVFICEGFREMSVGQWENLTFSEIRACDPDAYEARGKQIGYYAPPGGESFMEAGERFGRCLGQICRQCGGNLLVVSHAGVIRGYICRVLGISPNRVFELPQPLAGVTVLEERQKLSVVRLGYCPPELPDEYNRQERQGEME